MTVIERINKVKQFLREIADPVNEWEWGDGESMAEDMQVFLEYLRNLER